jgi:hypothetical protein
MVISYRNRFVLARVIEPLHADAADRSMGGCTMRFGLGFARLALFALLLIGVFVVGAGAMGFIQGLGRSDAAAGLLSLYAILSGLGGIAGAMVGFAITDTAENTENMAHVLMEMRKEMERTRTGRA